MAAQVHEDFLAPTPEDPAEPKPDADATPEPLVSVVVADSTQIGHDGKVYPGGSTVSAPAGLAGSWIAYGWATPAPKAVKSRK